MAEPYTKKEVIRILKTSIEAPDMVSARVRHTLQEIVEKPNNAGMGKRFFRYRTAAVFMVLFLFFGAATVGAAGVFHWNPAVAEIFEADEAQQEMLAQRKVTVPVEAGAAANGVTISLEQSLVTETYMYLYFKITAPEGKKLSGQLFFEEASLDIEGGEIGLNYSSGLSDGTEEEDVAYWNYFVQYDTGQKEINGRKITAHFRNMKDIGGDREGEHAFFIDGVWDISWNLECYPSEKSFPVNQRLDAGITVKEVIVSPISLEVKYDWPRQETPVQGTDQNGNAIEFSGVILPPVSPVLYRMKDGTLENIVIGAEQSGYENDSVYAECFGCNKVYMAEDIRSVVFLDKETGRQYEVELSMR